MITKYLSQTLSSVHCKSEDGEDENPTVASTEATPTSEAAAPAQQPLPAQPPLAKLQLAPGAHCADSTGSTGSCVSQKNSLTMAL